ncbi:MAG TPA: hypothetical protein VE891_04885 [Allosphingosinicella sp.]|nr:hypothetical protein [Allosphingosinicella sp.]
MLLHVMAALLAAAPLGAAPAEQPKAEGWALAAMQGGCMVQAVSPHGTMLSIWAFAGEEKLGFLLQNRGWEVEDGKKTALQVEFSGARTLPVEATARADIDSDGPGLYFTVEPGGAEPGSGRGDFLAAFTSARGMSIRRDGASVDTLPLAGSRGAIGDLAKCLADRWNEAGPAPAEAKEETPAAPDDLI